MARKPKSKPLSRAALKQFRADIRAARKAGLISLNLDPKTIKPTKHYLNLVKKNQDVIRGESVFVRIWQGLKKVVSDATSIFRGKKVTRAQNIAAANNARAKGSGIIVRKRSKSEEISFDKKTGRIVRAYEDKSGNVISRESLPKGADLNELQSQGYWFVIDLPPKFFRAWQSADEMVADMDLYHRLRDGTVVKNWRDLVSIQKLKPTFPQR